jgi:hypothetical protein
MQRTCLKNNKIYMKKSANTFPTFTYSLALCGTIWSTLACRVALYYQDVTSLFSFSFSNKIFRFLWTYFTHCHRMCLLLIGFVTCFFLNSAITHHQMAEHSRGIFSKCFHATHTQYIHKYINARQVWATQKVGRTQALLGLWLQSVKWGW